MSDNVADFDYPASGRFGTALAPAPLMLSQELANTIGMDHLPVVDLLGISWSRRPNCPACALFGTLSGRY
jgi:hypothetical protein